VENLVKATAIFLFLSILILGFTTAPAFADSIAVQNASFETTYPLNLPCGAGCAYNYGSIPDWVAPSGGTAQGSWQPSSAYFASVPDGSIVAFSNGGAISQTLSASLLASTLYTLSVAVGNRADAVTGGFATSYIIQLFAGNTLLNSVTDSNTGIPLGTFQDISLNYLSEATLPSGNLSIALRSVGGQTDFDNVRLTATSIVTPVPEPGTLTLLAAGLGLALFVFRRR
jgi:hypothetical protein